MTANSTSTSTVSTSTESAETLALRARQKAQKIEARASAKRASNSVKRDSALGVAVKPSKATVNESPADASELVTFYGLPYGELLDAVMSGVDAKGADAQLSRARRLACSALYTMATCSNLDKTHKTALTSLCLSARVSHGGLLTAVSAPKGTILPATSETALSILRYVHHTAIATRATVEATRAKKAEAEAEAARVLAEANAVNSAALSVVKTIISELKLSKAQKALLASMTDAQWAQFGPALRASING